MTLWINTSLLICEINLSTSVCTFLWSAPWPRLHPGFAISQHLCGTKSESNLFTSGLCVCVCFPYLPVQRTCSGSHPPCCQQGAMSTARSVVENSSHLKQKHTHTHIWANMDISELKDDLRTTPTRWGAAAQGRWGGQHEFGLGWGAAVGRRGPERWEMLQVLQPDVDLRNCGGDIWSVWWLSGLQH